MDNLLGGDTPMVRNLWEHVGRQLPGKGGGGAKGLDPQKLQNELLTAIDALYGHYEKTHALWREAGSASIPSSSWCATTPRPRSSYTITLPATRSRTPRAMSRR